MNKTYRVGFRGFIPLVPNLLVFKPKLSPDRARIGERAFGALREWLLASDDPKLQALGRAVIFEIAS
jgi:hypothetical protein